jgi:hypothetical protein
VLQEADGIRNASFPPQNVTLAYNLARTWRRSCTPARIGPSWLQVGMIDGCTGR